MITTILTVVFFPLLLLRALFRAFLQTIPLAIGQVWANKVRSLLTALGIIIGVASVIAVIGGLTGFRGHVLAEFESMGAKKLWINGYVPRELRKTMNWTDARPSIYEAQQIQEHADNVELVTPVCFLRMSLSYGDNTLAGTRVQGFWPEWHEIENEPIKYGRPFSRIDLEERRQVVILNEAAVRELTLPDDPSGATVQLDGRRFRVIGVTETTQLQGPAEGGDVGGRAYIPYSTAKTIDPYSWHLLMAQATTPESSDDAEAEVEFILRNVRGLRGESENTFRIEKVQAIIDQVNQMATVITAIAGGIVAISLVVGGVGIMNIMLVSVSERTREIGLRKAVGAPAVVVLLQFLVEAIVLCTLGGLVGLAAGMGLFELLKSQVDEIADVAIPTWAVVLALTFSGSVGLVFGIFPAFKAAMLNPIDALRHE